jgi:putative transposase
VAPFQWFVVAVCAWLRREQTDLIAFLLEENRVLKSGLGGRRLRFDAGERRRLGELENRLGRRLLAQVSTVVTPDTILRWHRELVARNGPTEARSRVVVVCRHTSEP